MTDSSLNQQSASVLYGSTVLNFEIERVHRRTLAISVYPDLRIVARAPIATELEAIKAKIKKRAAWIIKQRVYFSDFLPPTTTKTYQAGETFWYLGRQYRLKIAKGLTSNVRIQGQLLSLSLASTTNNAKKLINAWYYLRSENHFKY